MTWTVHHYNDRLSEASDGILKMIDGLIVGGAEVYGSGDGTLFDNSGSGATNYWVNITIPNIVGAWIRLRWPAVGGVTREMCMRRTNAGNRYEIWWSQDGIGFTAGAGAGARPTAIDEEFTHSGTQNLQDDYVFGSTSPSIHITLITGDAAEGYSWLWAISLPTTFGLKTVIFMDVLTGVPVGNADADPCVYGTKARGTVEFPSSSHGSSFRNDTTINNADDNIAGWFRKGEANENWVCYPMINWGTVSNGANADNAYDTVFRTQELLIGQYEVAIPYIRGSDTFGSERGPKGVSRLFGLTRQTAHLGLNQGKTRRHIGRGLTIPWDGVTVAREF